MAQNDGEKEIVLGNKQLISLFFVVVALLGVFFAAGYLIGRKSAAPIPGLATTDGGSTTASSSSAPRDSEPPRDATPEPAAPLSASAQSAPASTQPLETRPTRETLPEEREGEKPAKKSHVEKSSEAAVTKPEAGATYLQVTALRHPDADNLVRSLREQNFPTTLAASSKEGLFRVMVGPFHETSKVAEAKARLKGLGFANAFVQH